MSATTHPAAAGARTEVAVLLPAGRSRAGMVRRVQRGRERPWVRLAGFAALGAYGTLRWATLMSPAPQARLAGIAALAIALTAAGVILRRRTVAVLWMLSAVCAVGLLAICGVPVGWIIHVRIAVSARALGDGLSALPGALVPYIGADPWLKTVILLGAGALLLSSALLLALAPRPLSDRRRALAAVPLLALAVVPSTLVHPQLAYLQGLLLFALLAVFLWGERVAIDEVALAAGVLGLAAGGAIILAPRVDPHRAWLDYQNLAGQLSSTQSESFDWTQRYGPLRWPRVGREVLEVGATHPDYWKAENLEVFDGQRWLAASASAGDLESTVAAQNLRRWSQSLHVSVEALRTPQVIAAGVAGAPQQLSIRALRGATPGTWIGGRDLRPGDTYSVSVYSPRPSAAELSTAGTAYPRQLLPGYLSLLIPVQAGVPAATSVVFAPFGSSAGRVYGPSAEGTSAAVMASPYARVYRLALELRRGAATPYAYVMRVERYLHSGFRYDERATPGPYPLARFLLHTKTGYCQQFAGAMTLLLRMGGIPARVAVGFTSGNYDATRRAWRVADTDAHAWVEAWFPSIGWVRLEPTPAVAPEFAGGGALAAASGAGSAARLALHPPRRIDQSAAGAAGTHARASGGGTALWPLLVAAIVLLALGALAWTLVRRSDPSLAERLTELQRAMARCGRPLAPSMTLAQLEQILGDCAPARRYVRELRLARFAAHAPADADRDRSALRAWLGAGLGVRGRLRALWALPPRARLHRGRATMPGRPDET